MLSGRKPRVLNADSGAQLAEWANLSTYGLPLAGPKGVLVCVSDGAEMAWIDLESYRTRLLTVPEDAYVGNLTWSGSGLLVTNPAGAGLLRITD